MQGNEILYKELKSLKRDKFPNDYVLTVEYNFDIINNNNYPGNFLELFVKYLAEIDIPTFFVEVITSYKKIDRDLIYLNSIHNNGKIKYKNSKIDFKYTSELKKDTFCILPWIHFYVNPQGNVLPCCNADEKITLGKYTNNNFDFNNKKIKKFRKNLLNNIEVPHCKTCYKKEKNNIKSPRKILNNFFAKEINNNLSDTVDPFKLKYIDIRLSNICNLKCRMCSGKFSNRIAQEEHDIWGVSKYLNQSNSLEHDEYFFKIVKEHRNWLERIYFAGGEPLINPMHYKILDLLIENNNTDLEIFYNTNFSILKYKNNSVMEYWKKFKNIKVGASIDLIGKQSNYVRNGVSYESLEKNYFLLKENCPDINFFITSVLSIFNSFNLCDLQKHWIENNQLSPSRLSINVLSSPSEMSLKCLPLAFKDQVYNKIKEHINFLKTVGDSKTLINEWETAINFMYKEDHLYLLEKFFKDTDILDTHRNQQFEEFFPEYKNLRSHIQ